VTASFSPAAASAAVGAATTVAMVAMGVQDLSGVELVVTYDPTVVEAMDAAPGSLLTLDGSAVAAERNFEPGRARVRFTRPTGTSGSGVVASITFRALRAGSAPLRVERLDLAAAGGTSSVAVPAGRITVAP
jgi:hypothetical protein